MLTTFIFNFGFCTITFAKIVIFILLQLLSIIVGQNMYKAFSYQAIRVSI